MNYCPIDTLMGVEPECLPLPVQEGIQESENSEYLRSEVVEILNKLTVSLYAVNNKTCVHEKQISSWISMARTMLNKIEEEYLDSEIERQHKQ